MAPCGLPETHIPSLQCLLAPEAPQIQVFSSPQYQAISYGLSLKTGSDGLRIMAHPSIRIVPKDLISRMALKTLCYMLTHCLWFQVHLSTRLNHLAIASRPVTKNLAPNLSQVCSSSCRIKCHLKSFQCLFSPCRHKIHIHTHRFGS